MEGIASKPRTKRSPKWPALCKRFLKGKACAACGRAVNVVAHHKQPFHLHPELELDESNLIPLCEGRTVNCHLAIGHLFSWKSINAEVEADAAYVNNKVRNRP
jgi:5-methylcytosine-specific restriction enzyme A